jgi:Zn-finger nucleic acid-binding protein
MKCPICDIEMKIAEREGVEIDYCPQCRGVWLDRGELEKIIARVESPESSGRGQDEDDEGDEDDREEDDRDRYAGRDSRRGRDGDSRRDDQNRRDDQYSRTEQPRSGGQKREGFLSNLFEMFGGD